MGGSNTLYTLHTSEKGKLGGLKGEREKVGGHFVYRIPLGNQSTRTHTRTHERNDFPVGLHPISDFSRCELLTKIENVSIKRISIIYQRASF